MSLTTCLKRAGDLLGAEHRTAILARAKELTRAGGMTRLEAARKAVDEQIQHVTEMLRNAPEASGKATPASRPIEAPQARELSPVEAQKLTPSKREQELGRLLNDSTDEKVRADLTKQIEAERKIREERARGEEYLRHADNTTDPELRTQLEGKAAELGVRRRLPEPEVTELAVDPKIVEPVEIDMEAWRRERGLGADNAKMAVKVADAFLIDPEMVTFLSLQHDGQPRAFERGIDKILEGGRSANASNRAAESSERPQQSAQRGPGQAAGQQGNQLGEERPSATALQREEPGANGTPRQPSRQAQVDPQVASDLATLDRHWQDLGANSKLEVVPASDVHAELARKLATGFNAPIEFVRNAEGETPFNAATMGGRIYIAVDGEAPSVALAVHEIGHNLPTDIKAKLITEVMGTTSQAQRDKFAKEFPGYGRLSKSARDEEMVMKIIEQDAQNASFWDALRKKMGDSEFGRLAKSILDTLDKIMSGFAKEDSSEFTGNIKRVRQAVAEAYSHAAERAAEDRGFTPLFSAKRGDKLKDIAGLARIEKHLTPQERNKLNAGTAQRLVDQWKKLPPAKEFAAIAWAGRAKRGWYRESAQAIAQVFGPDATRFAGLLAAMSPQCSVQTNLLNSLKTWNNWVAAGRPQSRAEIVKIMGRSVEGKRGDDSVLDAWINNSVTALTSDAPGEDLLSGPKVDSFMRNLLGDTEQVTNDAWMANFALVSQSMFSGSRNKTDAGKGPGYLAMNASVREAARMLTKFTGELWTPAEVQETIWSWAKTLYEAQSEGNTATDILYNGELTDEMIRSTPDFKGLFHDEKYASILRSAGLGKALDGLSPGGAGSQVARAGSEAGPFDSETQSRLENRAATRLEILRKQGRPEFSERRDRDRGGREESGRFAPLEGAPSVPGVHGPDPRIVGVAEQYARDQGIKLTRQREYVKVDVDLAARIADAYAEMKHAPQDPAVREAYDNLIKQTTAQYRALERAGYKFWFIDTRIPSNAEYADTPWNAIRDMRANQQMGVFPTTSGFGSSDLDVSNNPLLKDTGVMWPVGGPDGKLQPVLANDMFRAVHDAFGHGIEGAGFRAQGEENAWQAHARLFTGSALGAITSETRGQNSWLNYGPHGEHNRTAKVEDTIFADQKTGLMPAWTWTDGFDDGNGPSFSEKRRNPQIDTPEFKRWFKDSKVVDNDGNPLVVYHGTDTGGFDTFKTPSGSKRGDLGIFTTQNRAMASSYVRRGRAKDLLPEQLGDGADRVSGTYPVYLSLQDPYEVDMEGANFDGSHPPGTFEVYDSNGDIAYTEDGRKFMPLEEARDLADQIGGTFEEATPGQSTDGYVREARSMGFDGVIIRNVVDDGGGNSPYAGEPSDVYVAFKPEQIKSANGNSGAFDPSKPSILASEKRRRDASQIGFYSQLTRAAEAGPGKGTAQAWKDYFKGQQSKGVKSDEIEWSGVNDWLDLQTGSVTKGQVVDYLKNNGVQVTETVLGSAGPTISQSDIDAAEVRGDWDEVARLTQIYEDQQLGNNANESGNETKYQNYTVPGGKNYREVLLTLPQAGRMALREKAIKARAALVDVLKDQSASEADKARIRSEYDAIAAQLDANPPYKSSHWDHPNILAHVRVDDRESIEPLTAQQQQDNARRADMLARADALAREIGKASRDSRIAGDIRREELLAKLRPLVREGKMTPVEMGRQLDEAAYAEPSAEIAAKIAERNRLMDSLPDEHKPRTQRVLFVNEIQSDWGQQGKKQGFAMPESADPVVEVRLVGSWHPQFPEQKDKWRVTVDGQDRGYIQASDENEARYKAAANEENRRSNSGKVPPAPFIGKTDAWVSLAIKRLVKMAVDGGYDKVAFISGEQAADLYDLSKQVSRVEYTDAGVLIATDINGREAIRETVPEDKIEDYIGKEAARKLLEAPETRNPSGASVGAKLRRIEGDGLKVGGEGMKTFYDKIVPNVAKDVLRKAGGKTSEVQVDTAPKFDNTPDALMVRINETSGGQFRVGVGAGDERVATTLPTRKEAEDWAKAQQAIARARRVSPQIGFEITPEIRSALVDGQPLFSERRGRTPVPQAKSLPFLAPVK